MKRLNHISRLVKMVKRKRKKCDKRKEDGFYRDKTGKFIIGIILPKESL